MGNLPLTTGPGGDLPPVGPVPAGGDTQPPELYVTFLAESGQIDVQGIDDADPDVEVNATVLSEKPNKGVAQLVLRDDAANSLVAEVEVRTSDGNRELQVLSLEYSDLGAIGVAHNFYKVGFKTDPRDETALEHVHQNLLSTWAAFKVETMWQAKSDRTRVSLETPVTMGFDVEGLAVFSVATNRGALELGMLVDGARDVDADGLENLDEVVAHGTDPRNSDTDGDGMMDGWEVRHALDPLDPSDAAMDADGDLLTNLGEHDHATNPRNPDTDGDGLTDGDEVLVYATDPLSQDPDADGWTDAVEVLVGTNPFDGDSDDDGLLDGAEPAGSSDTDGDGLVNALDPDSDDDGMPDGWEVAHLLDPLADDAMGDLEADGLPNLDEYVAGTGPERADTDYDGLGDGTEVGYGLQPLAVDSDADALQDGLEVAWNVDSDGDGLANALDPDSDNDGLPDGAEIVLGTSMVEYDTDGDGLGDMIDPDPLDRPDDPDRDRLTDALEASLGTNPANPDTDDDGLADGREVEVGTDPLNPDTDGDTLTDGEEVLMGSNPLSNPALVAIAGDAILGIEVVVDFVFAVGPITILPMRPGEGPHLRTPWFSAAVLDYFSVETTEPVNGAVIKRHYDPADLGHVGEAGLVMASWNGPAANWETGSRSGVNEAADFVWVATTHLSAWTTTQSGCNTGSGDCDKDGLTNDVELHGLVAYKEDFGGSETLAQRGYTVSVKNDDGDAEGVVEIDGDAHLHVTSHDSQESAYATYGGTLEIDYTRSYYVSFRFRLPTSQNRQFHVFSNRQLVMVVDPAPNSGSATGTWLTVESGGTWVALKDLNDPNKYYAIEINFSPYGGGSNCKFEVAVDGTKMGQRSCQLGQFDTIGFLLGDNDAEPGVGYYQGEGRWDDFLIRQIIDLDEDGATDASQTAKDVFVEVDWMAQERLFVNGNSVCGLSSTDLLKSHDTKDGVYAKVYGTWDDTRTSTGSSFGGFRIGGASPGTSGSSCDASVGEYWELRMKDTALSDATLGGARSIMVYVKHYKSGSFTGLENILLEFYDGSAWQTIDTWSSGHDAPTDKTKDYNLQFDLTSYMTTATKMNALKFRYRSTSKDSWNGQWFVDAIMVVVNGDRLTEGMRSSVANAFGARNVRFHFDDRDDDGRIPFVNCLMMTKGTAQTDFWDIKHGEDANHNGKLDSGEDANGNGRLDRHFPYNRLGVFHYLIVGNRYDSGSGCDWSTGYAFFDDDDFFVAYAAVYKWSGPDTLPCGDPGSDYSLFDVALAGTVMHELGHNLGLGKTGTSATVKYVNIDACGPDTYPSLMSYKFQMTGVDAYHKLDYSPGANANDAEADDPNDAKDFNDWGSNLANPKGKTTNHQLDLAGVANWSAHGD